jgi:hypothetical protein
MPGQCLSCTPRRRFHQPVDQILSSRPHKYSGIGNLKHRASEEYRSEVCDAVDLAQRFQIHFHVLRHPAALAEKRNAAEVGRNSVCGPGLPQLISRTRRSHVGRRDAVWVRVAEMRTDPTLVILISASEGVPRESNVWKFLFLGSSSSITCFSWMSRVAPRGGGDVEGIGV